MLQPAKLLNRCERRETISAPAAESHLSVIKGIPNLVWRDMLEPDALPVSSRIALTTHIVRLLMAGRSAPEDQS